MKKLKKSKCILLIAVMFCCLLTASCSAKTERFYGEWEVTRLLDMPLTSSAEFIGQNYIGEKITYEKKFAESWEATLKNPVYHETKMTKYDYETGYRMDFKKLGVKGNTVKRVEVWDSKSIWNSTGNTIFVVDNDTLILWTYNCFEMKRVK